jgi:DNA-directed RNA polymerase specialized sigma24 family protein
MTYKLVQKRYKQCAKEVDLEIARERFQELPPEQIWKEIEKLHRRVAYYLARKRARNSALRSPQFVAHQLALTLARKCRLELAQKLAQFRFHEFEKLKSSLMPKAITLLKHCQDAEDALQDVSFRVSKYDRAIHCFEAFCNQTLTFICEEVWRKRKRNRATSIDTPLGWNVDTNIFTVKRDPNADRIKEICDVLPRLQERQRQTIALFLDGLSFKQIADRLEVAEATARAGYKSGIEEIRRKIAIQHDEEIGQAPIEERPDRDLGLSPKEEGGKPIGVFYPRGKAKGYLKHLSYEVALDLNCDQLIEITLEEAVRILFTPDRVLGSHPDDAEGRTIGLFYARNADSSPFLKYRYHKVNLAKSLTKKELMEVTLDDAVTLLQPILHEAELRKQRRRNRRPPGTEIE